jgi:HAD superfamily hydrolase (TIGR01509 family)
MQAKDHRLLHNFDAVLFDFDGTLVDTMPLHYQAYKTAFAEIGIDLKPEDFYNNIGGKATDTIVKFLGGRESPVPTKEIHLRKKQALKSLIDNQPIVVLETAKLLPLLAQHFKIGLVSSGASEGIYRMLGKLQWEKYFEVVITGDDVILGKPNPESYLVAANRLKVLPENCLVFEDTDDGILAAENAGMATFDVRKTIPQIDGLK